MPSKTTKGKEKDGHTPSTQPARGTFTADEVVTLKHWLPRYMQLKRAHGRKFVDFWEPLWEEFFKNHPLQTLTEEEIAGGIEQGDRKGERMTKVQQVSESCHLS